MGSGENSHTFKDVLIMDMSRKRLFAAILAAVLTLGCMAGFAPNVQAADSFSAVGGWNESLFAEIEGIADTDVTAVAIPAP